MNVENRNWENRNGAQAVGARLCEPQQWPKVGTLSFIARVSVAGGVAAGYKPALRGDLPQTAATRNGCSHSAPALVSTEPLKIAQPFMAGCVVPQTSSPAGTKETSRSLLPSLRDLDSLVGAIPGHKWLGYYQRILTAIPGANATAVVDKVALRPCLAAQRTLEARPSRRLTEDSAALRCAGGGMVAARPFPPRDGAPNRQSAIVNRQF